MIRIGSLTVLRPFRRTIEASAEAARDCRAAFAVSSLAYLFRQASYGAPAPERRPLLAG